MRLQLWMVALALITFAGCSKQEAPKVDATSGGEAFAPPTDALLAAGNGESCGLRAGGALYCWGRNAEQAPKGIYHRVAAGFGHGCAIRAEAPRMGELDCWGRNEEAQATPPAGKFIEVAAGYAHTCALRPNGKAVCFGNDPSGATKPPAGSTYTAISAGKGFSCGITKGEGSIECWGNDDDQQIASPIGHFAVLSSGPHHSCAVAEDGTLQCWGKDSAGENKVPEGRFRSISAGLEHTCGLLRDHKVLCFGGNAEGQTAAPDGTFTTLAAGWMHTCGIRENGDVECWGKNFNGESTPHEQFTHVSGHAAPEAVASKDDEPAPSASKSTNKSKRSADDKAAADEPAPKASDEHASKSATKTHPDAEPADKATDKKNDNAASDMSFNLEEASSEPTAKPKSKAEEPHAPHAKEKKEKPKSLDYFLK